MSRMNPRPKHPTLRVRLALEAGDWASGVTHMQKNGEIKEDKARTRTVK
jgi:hypothetical protein